MNITKPKKNEPTVIEEKAVVNPDMQEMLDKTVSAEDLTPGWYKAELLDTGANDSFVQSEGGWVCAFTFLVNGKKMDRYMWISSPSKAFYNAQKYYLHEAMKALGFKFTNKYFKVDANRQTMFNTELIKHGFCGDVENFTKGSCWVKLGYGKGDYADVLQIQKIASEPPKVKVNPGWA